MCQHSVSRRDFFQRMALGATAATPILELGLAPGRVGAGHGPGRRHRSV